MFLKRFFSSVGACGGGGGGSPPSLTSRISLNRRLNLPSIHDFGAFGNVSNGARVVFDKNSSSNNNNNKNSNNSNNNNMNNMNSKTLTTSITSSVKEDLYKGRRITVGLATEVNTINDLYDPRSFKRQNKWTDQNRAISLASTIIKNENILTEKKERLRNVYPHLIKNKRNIEKRRKKFMDMRAMVIDEILDLQQRYK